MTARIIDGKDTAARVRRELAGRVGELVAGTGVTPGLAVILAGDDPASAIYVRNKEKAAGEIGIRSSVVRLPAGVSQAELLGIIDGLNRDPGVHGILVQAPVPAGLDFEAIVLAIDPAKDVDGFHPLNMGLLARGFPGRIPGRIACTPKGVMRLLRESGIDPAGRHAVVVGRSTIVGRPMSLLLLAADATVTICHRATRDLGALTRTADILVVAAGRPGMITADMVKPGAAVIDVGMNRTAGGLVGDVDFAGVRETAGWITPVPGGVGPMTVAMLLENTVEAAEGKLGLA